MMYIEICYSLFTIISGLPDILDLKNRKEVVNMKKVCIVCGWEYDPAVGDEEHGIAPGTAFEDLPDDFVCPLCGVGKDQFEDAE